MNPMRQWVMLLILLSGGLAPLPAVQAQQPALPVAAARLAGQLAANETLPTAPLKEARRTLARARQRFGKGLAEGETLFVTAKLLDASANRVPQLVQVQGWQSGRLQGWLVGANVPEGTEKVEFDETEVADWLILHSDGTEEGNYVGKYLDLEERLGSLTAPH